jgi:glycosyltransferase involved in cell wall biosynthesis
MKILFDHSAFNQVYGGVPKYFVEIIRRLSTYDADVDLCVKYSNNHYLQSLNKNIKPFYAGKKFRGKAKLERFLGDFFLIKHIIFSRNIALYHATHYSSYARLILGSKVKFVSTIHDMNNWVMPEYYPKYNIRKIRQAIQMKYCDQIIAISKKTHDDIIRFYPEYANKIVIIHHGVNEVEDINFSVGGGLPKTYILYVGARNTYKNFEKFIGVFSLLSARNSDLHLICAGQEFTSKELESLKNLSIDSKVTSMSVTDTELRSLYKHASLFVFPSFYEGFGLPCLEAMSAGCPIAVSNNSVFPEICGPAAKYFDPNDSDSMFGAIQSVLYDKDCRGTLQREMVSRIGMFSWDLSAKKHYLLYQDLVKNA